MTPKVSDIVTAHWPEMWAKEQAGIVTGVLPSGRVNVRVFLDYHNAQDRMFMDVPVLAEAPAVPGTLKWVQFPAAERTPILAVHEDGAVERHEGKGVTHVLNDETGPAIPAPAATSQPPTPVAVRPINIPKAKKTAVPANA